MIFREPPKHTELDLTQSLQRHQLPRSIGSKRLTFSFDDGVRQDVRLLEILNCYRLKATFNLNSALMGKDMTVSAYGKTVPFRHFTADEIPAVYCGHEIAAHTRTHRDLTKLSEHEIISEIEGDRLTLSDVCGYAVIGMAYPGEGCNHDNRVLSLIRAKSKIQYARTVQCSGGFADPTDLLQVNPTARATNFSQLNILADQFLSLPASQPALFYIWGHSFDFDIFDGWGAFKAFCEKISGHADISYCTNREALFPCEPVEGVYP